MSVSSKKSLAQANEEMNNAFLVSAREDHEHVIEGNSKRASRNNKKQERELHFVGLDEIQSDGEEAYLPQSPPPPAPRESSETKVEKARLMARSYFAALERARNYRLEQQEASDNICHAWGEYDAPRYEMSDDCPFLVNKVVGPTAIVTNARRDYNIIEQLRYEKEEREREEKKYNPNYESSDTQDAPKFVDIIDEIAAKRQEAHQTMEQIRLCSRNRMMSQQAESSDTQGAPKFVDIIDEIAAKRQEAYQTMEQIRLCSRNRMLSQQAESSDNQGESKTVDIIDEITAKRQEAYQTMEQIRLCSRKRMLSQQAQSSDIQGESKTVDIIDDITAKRQDAHQTMEQIRLYSKNRMLPQQPESSDIQGESKLVDIIDNITAKRQDALQTMEQIRLSSRNRMISQQAKSSDVPDAYEGNLVQVTEQTKEPRRLYSQPRRKSEQEYTSDIPDKNNLVQVIEKTKEPKRCSSKHRETSLLEKSSDKSERITDRSDIMDGSNLIRASGKIREPGKCGLQNKETSGEVNTSDIPDEGDALQATDRIKKRRWIYSRQRGTFEKADNFSIQDECNMLQVIEETQEPRICDIQQRQTSLQGESSDIPDECDMLQVTEETKEPTKCGVQHRETSLQSESSDSPYECELVEVTDPPKELRKQCSRSGEKSGESHTLHDTGHIKEPRSCGLQNRKAFEQMDHSDIQDKGSLVRVTEQADSCVIPDGATSLTEVPYQPQRSKRHRSRSRKSGNSNNKSSKDKVSHRTRPNDETNHSRTEESSDEDEATELERQRRRIRRILARRNKDTHCPEDEYSSATLGKTGLQRNSRCYRRPLNEDDNASVRQDMTGKDNDVHNWNLSKDNPKHRSRSTKNSEINHHEKRAEDNTAIPHGASWCGTPRPANLNSSEKSDCEASEHQEVTDENISGSTAKRSRQKKKYHDMVNRKSSSTADTTSAIPLGAISWDGTPCPANLDVTRKDDDGASKHKKAVERKSHDNADTNKAISHGATWDGIPTPATLYATKQNAGKPAEHEKEASVPLDVNGQQDKVNCQEAKSTKKQRLRFKIHGIFGKNEKKEAENTAVLPGTSCKSSPASLDDTGSKTVEHHDKPSVIKDVTGQDNDKKDDTSLPTQKEKHHPKSKILGIFGKKMAKDGANKDGSETNNNPEKTEKQKSKSSPKKQKEKKEKKKSKAKKEASKSLDQSNNYDTSFNNNETSSHDASSSQQIVSSCHHNNMLPRNKLLARLQEEELVYTADRTPRLVRPQSAIGPHPTYYTRPAKRASTLEQVAEEPEDMIESVLYVPTRHKSKARRRAKNAWLRVRQRLTGYTPVKAIDIRPKGKYLKHQEMMESHMDEHGIAEDSQPLAPGVNLRNCPGGSGMNPYGNQPSGSGMDRPTIEPMTAWMSREEPQQQPEEPPKPKKTLAGRLGKLFGHRRQNKD